MAIIDWTNKGEATEYLKADGMLLRGAPEEVKDDADLVLAAVYDTEEALAFASDRLIADLSFVLRCMQYGVRLPFSYKQSPLQDDEEAMITLTREYLPIVQFASDRLLNNEAFIKDRINEDTDTYIYVPDYVTDRDFLVDLFKKDIRLASVVPQGKFVDDKEIMLSCLHCVSYYYIMLDESLKKDIDILNKLFRHPKAFRHVAPEDKLKVGLRFNVLPNEYWLVRQARRRR